MRISKAIYLYMMHPKYAMRNNINFESSFLIYLLSILSIAVSALYTSNSKCNILNLFLLAFGIAAYISVSNIVKIAIINLTVSVFFKNNDKKNITTFINNCFGIYGIFIFILPITLIFGNFSSIYWIQAGTLLILQLYYIVLMYNNIKYSFNIKSSFRAVLVLFAPIIYDYLVYMALAILILGSFINII